MERFELSVISRKMLVILYVVPIPWFFLGCTMLVWIDIENALFMTVSLSFWVFMGVALALGRVLRGNVIVTIGPAGVACQTIRRPPLGRVFHERLSWHEILYFHRGESKTHSRLSDIHSSLMLVTANGERVDFIEWLGFGLGPFSITLEEKLRKWNPIFRDGLDIRIERHRRIRKLRLIWLVSIGFVYISVPLLVWLKVKSGTLSHRGVGMIITGMLVLTLVIWNLRPRKK